MSHVLVANAALAPHTGYLAQMTYKLQAIAGSSLAGTTAFCCAASSF